MRRKAKTDRSKYHAEVGSDAGFETAFQQVFGIRCARRRRLKALAILLPWSRSDINGAWRAVTQSPFAAEEKQSLFNILWSD